MERIRSFSSRTSLSNKSQSLTRPAHHADYAGTAFKNPWPSAAPLTWTEIAQNAFPLGRYSAMLHSHDKAREVQVVTPDWGTKSLESKQLEKGKAIIGTWLGHAGALVELPLENTDVDGAKKSAWLLFDPIFSSTAGPTQFTGPTRMKNSPCQVADLPGCDAVFISHNHYDHLDLGSIKAILKRFPKARYFVPLGNKAWLLATGVAPDLVFELDWWCNRECSPVDLGMQVSETTPDEVMLRFTCVPAQHNSGRTVVDQGSSLWCGWVVEQRLLSKDESSGSKARRKGAIYHAGDTGYRKTARSKEVCPAFKEIGERLGPFDLSFVPIWRGGSLGFISYLGIRLSHEDVPSTFHGTPKDAVAIHSDVRSRNTIGVHFATFVGSDNESYEAMIEFGEACDEHGVGALDAVGQNGRAGTIDIGGSLAVEIE